MLRVKRPPHPDDPWTITLARKIRDYLLSAVFVTQTYAVRLAVILMAIPLWGLVMLYALVKGLNERALRTWGGGRESGTRFHWALLLFSSILAIPFIIYLAWPDPIHPSWVLLPGSVVVGYITYLITANYKKYL
jgi:integrating conjugative element membrane protein (TIGR03747 family)